MALGVVKNKGSSERQLASGDDGGYLKLDSADLDAEFTLNGILVTRSSNDVDDALEGLSFTLMATQSEAEAPVTLTISRNQSSIKEQIENFVNSYNESMKYLNEKSKVDTTTYTRGALTGNATYMGLKLDLRSMVVSSVEGIEDGNIKTLREIGISINRDGTLTIEDEDDLEDAITTRGDEIEDLFNSDYGIAKQMDNFLDRFVKTGGSIDDSANIMQRRIESIDRRIADYEERLEKEEESIRAKYVELQQALTLLNNQQSIINQSLSYMSSLSSYLGY